MHNQMAQHHEQMNHPGKAKQHRKMEQGYGKMKSMVPRADQSSNMPVNENADPKLLNGANLYIQNCASCHGSNAEGIGDVFPPLVNSKWITGNKSIPVRIVRDGLSGEVQVKGKTYNGSMPSFKARLSIAEIAAIVNFLRDSSDGNHPHITQEDVIEISKRYQ
ncbi:MAG: c-type cytochrome, partial [Aliifodinibius sp.]|nr:c-type cytochrome [Fodinibius sp.]NIV15405.1 c-type cytochrome [Fodinibius sp.]NIY25959.1 c-type cytochrome [Fodinibius sp.]